MVILYSSRRRYEPKLRRSLGGDQDIVLAERWREFKNSAPAADCAVVCIESLENDPSIRKLSAFKNRRPRHPVILVTEFDLENARRVADIPVEEVVWLRELGRDLSSVVRGTCSRDFNYVRCLAVPFREAEELPAPLREALAHACESEQPVRAVSRLAREVGYDRRTLWTYWTEAVGPSSTLGLKDFLSWILLLRAMGAKTPGGTWADAADQVGVHPNTLGGYARDLTGRTLPELEAEGEEGLVQLFRDRVLRFLLEGEPMDIP